MRKRNAWKFYSVTPTLCISPVSHAFLMPWVFTCVSNPARQLDWWDLKSEFFHIQIRWIQWRGKRFHVVCQAPVHPHPQRLWQAFSQGRRWCRLCLNWHSLAPPSRSVEQDFESLLPIFSDSLMKLQLLLPSVRKSWMFMRNKLVCFHSVMIISLYDCQKSCLSYRNTNTLMYLVAVLLCLSSTI